MIRTTKYQATQALLWLLPTKSEVAIYLFLIALTIFLSNIAYISNLLFIPADFKFSSAVLNGIGILVDAVFGAHAAAVPVAVFWGSVGITVYILIWLMSNFSVELSNDLAIAKFVHPTGDDPKGPLRIFISQTVFRVALVVLFIFFISIVTHAFLPLWRDHYKDLLLFWPKLAYIKEGAIAATSEFVVLHVITVFVRLLLLRKRVFG